MIICPRLTENQITELTEVVKHSKNALNIKRAQAILMVNSQGYTPLITELTNFKRSRVFGVRKLYLEKGLEANSYPRVEVNTKRENKTGKEHAFAATYQTMYETERILKKIRLSYPKRDNKGNHLKGTKILLFWDSAGWHKGSKVQEYIKKDGNITQIFFPRYTPELNPQEHVWNNAKERITRNKYIPDIEKTSKDFVSHLNSNRFNYQFLGIQP